MALVAYGSSDESDMSADEQEVSGKPNANSETKPASASATASSSTSSSSASTSSSTQSKSQTQGHAKAEVLDVQPVSEKRDTDPGPHISDDEDYFDPSDTGGRFLRNDVEAEAGRGLHLPAPKHSATAALVTSHSDSHNDHSGLLKGLPAPQKRQGTSGGIFVAEDEGELEDIVKPKAAELAIREKAPSKPKKNIVKITVPSIDQYDSDEEDGPSLKKPRKSSKGGSGLFSLLPQPVHATKKEVGRVLLPYTLSRKPKSATKIAAVPPKAVGPSTVKPGPSKLAGVPMVDSDSEPEEEESHEHTSANFFSLGERTAEKSSHHTPLLSPSVLSSTALTLPKSLHGAPDITATNNKPLSASLKADTGNTVLVRADSSGPHTAVKDEAVPPGPSSIDSLADAPLQFKSSAASQHQAQTGPSTWTDSHTEGNYVGNQAYNMANAEYAEDDESATIEGGTEDEYIQNEQFLRMQGKLGRGREQVEFIDVNADDMTSGLDLTKSLTQETDMKSHSKKKNKDMPSSQQKRKHQITYLAFQAKEREMDLKNQWADNRMTQKQTQSKYGF